MSAVSQQWFVQWRHDLPVLPAIDRHHTDPRITYSWAHFLNHDPDSGSYSQMRPSHDSVSHSNSRLGPYAGSYSQSRPSPYAASYSQSRPSPDAGRCEKKDGGQKRVNDGRLGYEYKKKQWNREEEMYEGGLRMLGAAMWLSTLTAARGGPNVNGAGSVPSVPADRDAPPFHTLYKWSQLDFEFPSAQYRDEALATGAYIPENVLPLGIEVWQERVFVTLPSWKKGLPATLCTVPRAGGIQSPLLRPYPDWTFHRYGGGNCSGLTSVFRVSADECGRLWVLDSGQVEAVDQAKQLCPPAVVVFDLNTDRLIARYNIPEKYVLQNSLFSNIVVDIRHSNCQDTHVYIADTWRFGLLVFREADQKFWRFSHHLFYPDPFASNYTLHGVNFQWSDGIFGLSLSPIYKNDRTLFFHPMSSFREFYVRTSIIRIPEAIKDSAKNFNLLGESRGERGQVSASAIDRQGVMFYNLVLRDSVACWNIRKPYRKSNQGVIATNHDTMIFPNDIKIDQEPRQSVWVITNRLPMFQEGPLDPYEYNFRIMYADTAEAVQGTVCDPAPPRRDQFD